MMKENLSLGHGFFPFFFCHPCVLGLFISVVFMYCMFGRALKERLCTYRHTCHTLPYWHLYPSVSHCCGSTRNSTGLHPIKRHAHPSRQRGSAVDIFRMSFVSGFVVTLYRYNLLYPYTVRTDWLKQP